MNDIAREERIRRNQLLGGLMAVKAVSGNVEVDLALQTYVEATKPIPVKLLEFTITKLLREDTNAFMPSIGTIWQRAALETLKADRRRRGLDPHYSTNTHAPGPVRLREGREEADAIRWINVARASYGLPEIEADELRVFRLPEARPVPKLSAGRDRRRMDQVVSKLLKEPAEPAEPDAEDVQAAGGRL